jgi:hypothetical protein
MENTRPLSSCYKIYLILGLHYSRINAKEKNKDSHTQRISLYPNKSHFFLLIAIVKYNTTIYKNNVIIILWVSLIILLYKKKLPKCKKKCKKLLALVTKIEVSITNSWFFFGGGGLTPFSAIFQLYHGDQFYWWKKPEYPKRTTDHGWYWCKGNNSNFVCNYTWWTK